MCSLSTSTNFGSLAPTNDAFHPLAGEFFTQQVDGVDLDQHLAVKILETVGQ